jgi:ferric-dicitrate binding protein FerR (iron transport regulator)
MMNTDEKYALAAARLLRDQIPPAQPAEEPARRDGVVAAMELALAQQTRRRRMVRAGYWTLAAAAGVLLTLKLTHGGQDRLLVEQMHGQGNLLIRQGQTLALSAATPLLVDDEVRSGEAGGATLGLSRGTRLELASASLVRVIEAGPTRRFLLLQGRVDASVAKLRANERLLVTTPDSEVEVRGTRFTVKVTDAPSGCLGASQRSAVDVQEGTVWVRSAGEEKVLTAGQSFTRPCAPPSSVQPLPTVEPSPPAREEPRKTSSSVVAPRRRILVPHTARTPDEIPEPDSRLAEQNDLLSSAMAAARVGQHEKALHRLDDLLARFPEGPLSETARVERQRIKAAQRPQP